MAHLGCLWLGEQLGVGMPREIEPLIVVSANTAVEKGAGQPGAKATVSSVLRH
jgi:hypothetical protein